MESSLKRFARRIVLLHLALLVPLLAVVFFASREVYQSARKQAIEQEGRQQALLVGQTASGIRGYYDSIFGDLDLLKPVSPDDDDAADDRIPRVETGELPYRSSRGIRINPALPAQLNGRVAHLFIVEKQSYIAHPYGLQAMNPSVAQLVDRNREWIGALTAPTISPLEQFNDRGFNLIGVPLGARQNFVLVASVPVRSAARRFLDDVNRTRSGAFLLDEQRTIMAASRADLVGTRIDRSSVDPQIMAALDDLQAKGEDGTEVLDKPFTLGPESFAPAVVSMQPVRVLDKTWYVVIASPLSEVSVVVQRLFRRAMWWAISLALCATAALVSTALQIIRTRARMEREKNELLERELKQAREIQLAWLPRQPAPPAREGDGARGAPAPGAVDIATINHPASRISGDFYNWFPLPDGRTVVAIGDVTGHGIAAAFLMATTQLLVRNTMPQTGGDPGRCLEEVNRQLCTQAFNGQFVTLLILVLDPHRGRIDAASAGHPAPLVGDGESFQRLPLEPNLVLGVEADVRYATEARYLPPRALLLLYTDGVCDVESPGGDRFGFDRLRRCLYGQYAAAQDVVDCVLGEIDAFRAQAPLCDDLTMVAVRLQPTPAPALDPAAAAQPAPAAIPAA